MSERVFHPADFYRIVDGRPVRRGHRAAVVAAVPKSGSTYLTRLLANLPGQCEGNVRSGFGNREQELGLEQLLLNTTFDYAAQAHLRCSHPTASMLYLFDVFPVVLVRNLFDCAVSIRDHLRRAHDWPMAFIPSDLHRWSDEALFNFIAEMVMPWYFNFYVNWASYRGPMRLITYEWLNRDPHGVLAAVAGDLGLAVSDADIAAAVDEGQGQQTRRNKAILGRGVDVPDDARARIMAQARWYEGVDFRPLGLPGPDQPGEAGHVLATARGGDSARLLETGTTLRVVLPLPATPDADAILAVLLAAEARRRLFRLPTLAVICVGDAAAYAAVLALLPALVTVLPALMSLTLASDGPAVDTLLADHPGHAVYPPNPTRGPAEDPLTALAAARLRDEPLPPLATDAEGDRRLLAALPTGPWMSLTLPPDLPAATTAALVARARLLARQRTLTLVVRGGDGRIPTLPTPDLRLAAALYRKATVNLCLRAETALMIAASGGPVTILADSAADPEAARAGALLADLGAGWETGWRPATASPAEPDTPLTTDHRRALALTLAEGRMARRHWVTNEDVATLERLAEGDDAQVAPAAALLAALRADLGAGG